MKATVSFAGPSGVANPSTLTFNGDTTWSSNTAPTGAALAVDSSFGDERCAACARLCAGASPVGSSIELWSDPLSLTAFTNNAARQHPYSGAALSWSNAPPQGPFADTTTIAALEASTGTHWVLPGHALCLLFRELTPRARCVVGCVRCRCCRRCCGGGTCTCRRPIAPRGSWAAHCVAV